ncbi:MAG: hypothetical protein OHK006_24190 [Thermodesulfovibrionales bacterium]
MNAEVIYSIATRIGGPGLGVVSYNALAALEDRRWLKLAVAYNNRSDFPKSRLMLIYGNPAKALFFLPKEYYRPLRKSFFDYMTSKIILRRGCTVFHGWNNQSLRSLQAARKISATAILECGSTYQLFREPLIDEEYRRFGLEPKKRPASARESSIEEFGIADAILVPSAFAKKTFVDAGFDEKKLHIMNRAANLLPSRPGERRQRPFVVLFVGRLSLRKGAQYLLEAWKTAGLKDAELHLVGSVDEAMKTVLSRYRDLENVKVRGFLKDPGEAYRSANVFVFPSLEEGSAKVTYEAMAAGLPVITTENSGSVVRDGMDGYIVPIRDAAAIREKILTLYENPAEASRMARNGLEHIRSFTWDAYRENLIATYERILSR